jgi:hypothetical protein
VVGVWDGHIFSRIYLFFSLFISGLLNLLLKLLNYKNNNFEILEKKAIISMEWILEKCSKKVSQNHSTTPSKLFPKFA